MTDFRQAIEVICEVTPRPSRKTTVPLADALGRVLAKEVASDVDLPPFDKATMDGFAVRAADVGAPPVTLDVLGDVAAGSIPSVVVGPGQAASVMTGAPVPDGADTVVMVEWTSGFGASTVSINRPVDVGANISPRKEIVQKGETVLSAGTRIGPRTSSLLAMAGCDPVPVWELPKVAVLSTGAELTAPGEVPGPAQIRDCNGPALVALLRELGLSPVDLGRVGDDRRATTAAIERGLEHDVLLVSGGVSAGAYDFVRDVLSSLGVETHFQRVAVKPGKPFVFGQREEKMVFGLPGNPVSAVVVFRVFVATALRIRMGMPPSPPRTLRARLTNDIRKKPDRLWFVPAALTFGDVVTAAPLDGAGSADIPTMARADGLVVAPRGETRVEQGALVDVVAWDWHP
jgi:molybdopterin molybdotransferase